MSWVVTTKEFEIVFLMNGQAVSDANAGKIHAHSHTGGPFQTAAAAANQAKQSAPAFKTDYYYFVRR